jgi:Zn-dependent protease
MSETLQLALLLIPCLVIAIVFHEVAHGWAALALGDPTAKERRRLTLNPLRHVDPVGTLLVPGALATRDNLVLQEHRQRHRRLLAKAPLYSSG